MHQRPGKTYSAGPMDGPDRITAKALISFFEDAADQTEGDVSFYMEQLVDYFRNHYKPSKGLDTPGKVLGL